MSTRAIVALSLALAACASPPPPSPDGAASPCALDEECDDGLFCNGDERCAPGEAGAGADGCVAGAPRCASGQRCVEASDRCETRCEIAADLDGDGHDAAECGGDDCDDGDAARAPGGLEVCDAAGHDEDCDRATHGSRDLDGDGHDDARCCNGEGAERRCGTDCDDASAGVGPTALEVCDGRDGDCDGAVDEGVLLELHPDADGDGWGADGSAGTGCFAGPGAVERSGDCDDADRARHPGAVERCDAARADEDCDGIANPASLCACDGDVSRPCAADGVCASGTELCVGGAYRACSRLPGTEVCNGLDDDCDATTDEGLSIVCWADADNDGWAAAGAASSPRCAVSGRASVGGCPPYTTDRAPVGSLDCDDLDSGRRPLAPEECDEQDDDCDAAIDEGATVDCYPDEDDDGHAAAGAIATARCPVAARAFVAGCPVGSTDRAPAIPDCADRVPDARPGQANRFADPYCASGAAPCTDPTGVPRCAPPGGACDASRPRASWDWDCDGVESPEPAVAECPRMCTGGCGAAGPVYDPGTACGAIVEHQTCTTEMCGLMVSPRCTRHVVSLGLRCR